MAWGPGSDDGEERRERPDRDDRDGALDDAMRERRAEAEPARFRVIDASKPREQVAAEAVAHLLRLRESQR